MERLHCIANTPAASRRPLDVLRAEARGVISVVRPDQQIAAQGEERTDVIGVLSGLVRCVRMTPDGRRHIGRFVRRGGVIGLGATSAFRNSIEAVTTSSIIRFSVHALEHRCAEAPSLRSAVVEAMTMELVARERMQFRTGRLWAEERIADFLLELVDEPDATDGQVIAFRMSRADIADHLGLTIETVSRTLSRLQREGVVRMADAHHLSVVDMSMLRALASGDGDARVRSARSG